LSRLGRLCLAMDLAQTVEEAIPKVMREVRSVGVCTARIAALDNMAGSIVDVQLQRRRCVMLRVVALALTFGLHRLFFLVLDYLR